MIKKLLMLALVLIPSVQVLEQDDTKKLGAGNDLKAYAMPHLAHEGEHGDHDGSSGSWQPERGYYEDYPNLMRQGVARYNKSAFKHDLFNGWGIAASK